MPGSTHGSATMLETRVAVPRTTGDPAAVLAVLLVTALAAALATGPLLEAWLGIDGTTVDLLARLEGPSRTHPLGTDDLGRDLLARLLEGGRVSLAVGLAGALLAAALGTLVGL